MSYEVRTTYFLLLELLWSQVPYTEYFQPRISFQPRVVLNQESYLVLCDYLLQISELF